jgi:hypothetical protein
MTRNENKAGKIENGELPASSNSSTDASSASTSPALSVEAKMAKDDFLKTRSHLTAAVRNVLLNNSPELLEMFFDDKKFKIQHSLKNTETQRKFLFLRNNSYVEGHNVQVLWPKNPLYKDLNPEDEKVSVYSYTKGELKGTDWFAFFGDVLDGALKEKGFLSTNLDPNPANNLFGKASWNLITTSMDLTPSEKAHKPVSIIQNIWGGWDISRNDFLEIVKSINDRFESAGIGENRIIFDEEFRHVKNVRFYKITSHLAFNEKALDKIYDLWNQKEHLHLDGNSRLGPMPEFIVPLIAVFDFFANTVLGGIEDLIRHGQPLNRRYWPSDKVFYKELMQVMGNGNYEIGKAYYNQMCQDRMAAVSSEVPYDQNQKYYFMGTEYDCLDTWLMEVLLLRRVSLGSPGFDNDLAQKTEWTTRAIAKLSEVVPLPGMLKYLGRENFSFFTRVNGFRVGHEDGDLEYFSNTAGDPEDHFLRAGGILSLISKETGILPTEIQRSLGSFR